MDTKKDAGSYRDREVAPTVKRFYSRDQNYRKIRVTVGSFGFPVVA